MSPACSVMVLELTMQALSLSMSLSLEAACYRACRPGRTFTLTIRNPQTVDGPAIGVSYDAFVDDVQVGTHNAASDLAKSQCVTCTALTCA